MKRIFSIFRFWANAPYFNNFKYSYLKVGIKGIFPALTLVQNAVSFFIFLLFITTPVFSQNNEKAKQTEIVILHTNDMHGRIDQLPCLSSMIKEIKAKHKNVILVTAGDLFSGNPIVDKYPEKGYPMIDLMNDVGFDVSTLGNHEFDYGPQILAKRIKEAKFPFIVSNMESTLTDFPSLKPWIVFKKGKTKVMILGITQVEPNGYPDTRPENCKKFRFTPGLEKTKEYTKLSKKKNVFIVLSHMGFEQDSILALQMPEINAIIGGHTHTTLPAGRKINGVMIAQAGYYVKYLGMMTITLEKNKIVSIKDTLLSLKGYNRIDTTVMKKVVTYNNNKELLKTAGYLGMPLTGESSLGIFMATATLQSSKADFAFQNSGGIRVSELPQGNITLKQIYELDPFSNEIMLCKMTPSQIRELISFGYRKEKKADMISAGLLSEIYINTDKSIAKVELFLPDGTKPDEQKVYNVALNSYVASSYKFSRTGEPTGTGVTTTDALLNMLSQIKSYNYPGIPSTKVIEK